MFGHISFEVILTLLNAELRDRLLYFTVVLASVVSMLLTINPGVVYKFFVIRTRRNFLSEWLRCFAVYGPGMIPGQAALSALTRLLKSMIHNYAVWLHVALGAVEQHLSGRGPTFVQHIATGKAVAGYIAGAVVIGWPARATGVWIKQPAQARYEPNSPSQDHQDQPGKPA
jgi:hypothetical protein